MPEAGLSEIQGTSVGGTQGAPEAIARAVCWFPLISGPTMLASPGRGINRVEIGYPAVVVDARQVKRPRGIIEVKPDGSICVEPE